MWYQIKSTNMDLSLTPTEKEHIDNGDANGLDHVQDDTYVLVWNDEGFDLDEVAPFLKKAKKSGNFIVKMEDHEGEDWYMVRFGPGYCEVVV